MRRFVLPLLAALSAPAYCQLSGDSLIQTAMTALSTNSSTYLQMTGTDMTAGVLTGYQYASYFNVAQVGERLYDRVNITTYTGSGIYAKPVMSLIGDGITLWRYDYVNNTYSAVTYGTYSGTQPADYTGTLFRCLTAMGEGYTSFPIMLLRQIYSGTLPSYQSWMPGVIPSLDTLGNAVYSVGQPPRRTITFVLSTGALTDVVYDDVTTMRGVQKKTDWTIHIVSGPTLAAPDFTFTPPRGARPIAGPRLPTQH